MYYIIYIHVYIDIHRKRIYYSLDISLIIKPPFPRLVNYLTLTFDPSSTSTNQNSYPCDICTGRGDLSEYIPPHLCIGYQFYLTLHHFPLEILSYDMQLLATYINVCSLTQFHVLQY